MIPLRRVVSGGQAGVDQAALRAARTAGLEIGGWCPPGRASEDGPIAPDLPLVETPDERSCRAPDVPRSQRTEWNVRDSDGTLILAPQNADALDVGTAFTEACASELGRPWLRCDPREAECAPRICTWLRARSIATLNVAGPSEATCPGIGEIATRLLAAVFSEAAGTRG